ncbi:MAG: PepSY domain-containing protein, partial [Planctomycetota bacterium]|nr:PepSY domain-containing protein [Planctomycetota bacterium]
MIRPRPDYRVVWRWHFYAGLLCIPFVIVLSISGAIYLCKPQIEDWNDRPYDQLSIQKGPANVAEQVNAALAAFPDSVPSGYELPRSANSASRVIINQGGQSIRVLVHPETLQVLHSIPENERFMRTLFKLHGELLMGDGGSNLVELAASWTIIMLITGLYLWWPRQTKGLGGILYPRLRLGSRIFWRDLHSVTGIWISTFALLLLLSGLPWAKFWGGYFKSVRQWTGTAVAQQDWTTGSDRKSARKSGEASGEHGGHGGAKQGRSGGGRWGAPGEMPKDMTAFNRVAATAATLHLDHPVVVAPPARGSDHWSVKSMTPNRPRRVSLT